MAIMRTLRRPNGRLLVELPVRHGKSTLCSQYLPAWYLMMRPDSRVMLTGYGNEFAAEWGARARDLFALHAPRLFGHTLAARRADNWTIANHTGGMVTAGTGGAVSGKGADLLIADDLIKDQQEAESAVERSRVHKWFFGDMLTRLEPGGRCIVVMSRRHPDDSTGQIYKLMESGGTPWEIIRLPALAEDNDPLGRQPGEALWPQRYPVHELERIRRDLELSGESYLWDCLYQQNPLGDPSLIEWPAEYFQGILYDQLPLAPDDHFATIIALDPSMGRNARTGDYSALLCIVADRRQHLWVEDSIILRLTSQQCEDTSALMIAERQPNTVVIECNGFQEVLADNIALKSPGAPIQKYISTMDKEVRIRMLLTPYLASHRLHLRNTPHNQLLLAQLRAFPTAQHDDGPDALCLGAIAFADLVKQVRRPAPPPLRLRV